MLAAATRMFALNSAIATPCTWGFSVRSFTSKCPSSPTSFTRLGLFTESSTCCVVRKQHTHVLQYTRQYCSIKVFSAWGKQHRYHQAHQGWMHKCTPCRGLFSLSRKQEEEDDRYARPSHCASSNGSYLQVSHPVDISWLITTHNCH